MKNTKQGFKLTSPFKLKDGPGDGKKTTEASTSSTKSMPAQSGGYAVTSTQTTVKKLGTGEEVKIVPKAERYKKDRSAWKGSDASLLVHNKKKRAGWDEQDKKARESQAKNKSSYDETTTKNTPELTEEKKGTTSDTFTSEEKRVQNRGEQVTNRQERKTGRQNLKRDERAIKNTAEYKSMTSAERKAVKNELRHGQTEKEKATGKSTLDRFGKDVKANAEQARKMKYGQAEQNKSTIRQEIERPGEATTTRKAQYDQGANPLDRSNTENYATVQKAEKGGEKVKVEPGSNLPESVEGTTRTYSSETKSSSGSTSGNQDAVEDKKYNFLAADNKIPDSINKPKPSAFKFVMKGFGSKAGFDFNKKK
jgi:hypothetical protein